MTTLGIDLRFPMLLDRDIFKQVRALGSTRLVVSLPWEFITPHALQADKNHGQTLRRLAERGGLCSSEALAVIEDRDYYSCRLSEAQANAKLDEYLMKWEANQCLKV